LALGVKNQINYFLRRLGNSQGSVPQAVRAVIIDANGYMENFASGTGSALGDRLYDGTHPAMIGAYNLALPHAAELNKRFAAKGRAVSNADLYDAALNPTGCLNANPALTGTAGLLVANTGITPVGQVSTGYKAYRGAGTAPQASVTFNCYKENPRTDGPASGERQGIAVNITGVGSSAETYIFQPTTNPSQAPAIAPGSLVELVCDVEFVSKPVNLAGLELQMAEVGPATPHQAVGMNRQVGFLMPSVAVAGRLKTPPFRLQSGVTAVSSYVRMVFDATSGAASGEIKLSNYEMRPVV
ncbi:hypothetical protein, partial [Paraburkholderia phenoliruptrix]|uniref:hypothetical protein n=1 Tax=Paraburkholderia phenoliruptrix TaxID=252970 RepID=UPI0034CF7068